MAISKNAARESIAVSPPATDVELVYSLVFLLSDDCPPWFHQLHSSVAQFTAVTVVCADASQYERVAAEHRPDGLIGCGNPACAELFTALVLTEPLQRPLCVLVEELAAETPPDIPADVIVPASPRYVQRQLETTMRLRAEARAALEANRELKQDLSSTRRQAAGEKRRLLAALVAERERLAQFQRNADELSLLREALVNTVSHELRTPILQLKSAVHMLYEDDPTSTLTNLARQATARLELSVQNVGQLTSSLEIELAPVVVREVVQAATRVFERALVYQDSASRLRLDLDERLPPVLGDKQGLVTVIQLLVENALKFSDDVVDIRARYDDQHVVISVQDYGIGIDKSQYRRIFDSFYQVDGSSTRQHGGMGIGLAIVRLILDKHHVKVEVVSRRGYGTTFTFRLKPVNLRTGVADLAASGTVAAGHSGATH